MIKKTHHTQMEVHVKIEIINIIEGGKYIIIV